MDDEHVFRQLGENDGGPLGCRFSKVGDLILKSLDRSLKKFDCPFFSLCEPLDNFPQRCRSTQPLICPPEPPPGVRSLTTATRRAACKLKSTRTRMLRPECRRECRCDFFWSAEALS